MDLLIKRIANVLYTSGSREQFIEDIKKKITSNSRSYDNCAEIIRDDEIETFVVISSGGAACTVEHRVPEKVKGKKIYIFMKVDQDPANQEPLRPNELPDFVSMEVGNNPLDLLYALSNEIFTPILHNPKNQEGWTELISKDLMEKFNNYLAQIYLTLGQINGKTQLPLPPRKIMHSDKISDKDKAHIFENSIITWSKQIRKVLETEPEQYLKSGNNPGPLVEIEFWKKKSDNLNSIYSQLKTDQVALITKTLRESKSTYTTQFDKLKKEIKIARIEANDNYLFLKSLKGHFEELCRPGREFESLVELFSPIMYIILLIWINSEYYKTASRLVVLIREICNAIITQANYFVNGKALLDEIQSKEDVENACKKLETTIDVCAKFKETYYDYKSMSENQWKFPQNVLFIRLDSFLERCHDISSISKTIVQFNKLDSIKIGCTKGKNLTETVQIIYTQFNEAVQDFTSCSYDVMDISQKQFDDDYFKFRNKIQELERRLASVITQAFDDADTLNDRFKLLDSFEELLKRPIIQDELEKKHIMLIEEYKKDLKCVQRTFTEYKESVDKCDETAPLYNNTPPISGALMWTKSLKDRIRAPKDKLAGVSPDIVNREEYNDAIKTYNAINDSLEKYEQEKQMKWEEEIIESSKKLKEPLLCKIEKDKTLKVNFDPELVKLLREVKYFLQMELEVPAQAAKIYDKAEIYRKQINDLDTIVYKYNTIVTTLHPVERPLVEQRIIRMDEILKEGIDSLKWEQDVQIRAFITKAQKVVNETFHVVEKMKKGLEKIRSSLSSINKPYIERKAKPMNPEEFQSNHSSIMSQVHLTITNDGQTISMQINDINDAVQINKSQSIWVDYLEFINDIIIEGLSASICTSMGRVNELFDMKTKKDKDYIPMFDIKIELSENQIRFDPEIPLIGDAKTIRMMVK